MAFHLLREVVALKIRLELPFGPMLVCDKHFDDPV
jgi:hypothetical protein